MRKIGPIVRLQVQLQSLKTGAGARQRYDPAPLTAVPALTLTEGGVWGWSGAGERLGDVHHRDHPSSKRRDENPISIGFTGHYAAMRERFAWPLADGIAGENILVDAAGVLLPADVAAGFAIVTGEGVTVRLGAVVVAEPCSPFSRYALRFPADERPDGRVTDALRFLGDGMRGYYARHTGADATIRLGDALYVI